MRERQRVNEREVEGVGVGEGVKGMERKGRSQSEEESSKALMLNTSVYYNCFAWSDIVSDQASVWSDMIRQTVCTVPTPSTKS